MTTTKQFWALFKFQAMINPFIFLSALIFFGMPFWIPLLNRSLHDYHPSLWLLLMNNNLFFVGFIGVMIIAPEIFSMGGAAGATVAASSGTEFLLTRAVDRPIYFRARAVFFYGLILVLPLLVFLGAFANPELRIDEYTPAVHKEILARLPDSVAVPADSRGVSNGITLPHGNVLVAGWHLAAFVVAAVGTQAFITLVYPLKFRRWIFWTVYMGLILGPLFFLTGKTSTNDPPTREEMAFFYFATHQVAVWIGVLAGAVVIQLWSERRMSRMEM